MARFAVILIGAVWALSGLGIFAQPQTFYTSVPGLATMGPFNLHFIRDVGLAFLASGSIAVWGAAGSRRDLAAAGVAWPLLHALFHLQIWAHRGYPIDTIFLFDLTAVIGPALLAVTCVALFPSGKAPISR